MPATEMAGGTEEGVDQLSDIGSQLTKREHAEPCPFTGSMRAGARVNMKSELAERIRGERGAAKRFELGV